MELKWTVAGLLYLALVANAFDLRRIPSRRGHLDVAEPGDKSEEEAKPEPEPEKEVVIESEEDHVEHPVPPTGPMSRIILSKIDQSGKHVPTAVDFALDVKDSESREIAQSKEEEAKESITEQVEAGHELKGEGNGWSQGVVNAFHHNIAGDRKNYFREAVSKMSKDELDDLHHALLATLKPQPDDDVKVEDVKEEFKEIVHELVEKQGESEEKKEALIEIEHVLEEAKPEETTEEKQILKKEEWKEAIIGGIVQKNDMEIPVPVIIPVEKVLPEKVEIEEVVIDKTSSEKGECKHGKEYHGDGGREDEAASDKEEVVEERKEEIEEKGEEPEPEPETTPEQTPEEPKEEVKEYKKRYGVVNSGIIGGIVGKDEEEVFEKKDDELKEAIPDSVIQADDKKEEVVQVDEDKKEEIEEKEEEPEPEPETTPEPAPEEPKEEVKEYRKKFGLVNSAIIGGIVSKDQEDVIEKKEDELKEVIPDSVIQADDKKEEVIQLDEDKKKDIEEAPQEEASVVEEEKVEAQAEPVAQVEADDAAKSDEGNAEVGRIRERPSQEGRGWGWGRDRSDDGSGEDNRRDRRHSRHYYHRRPLDGRNDTIERHERSVSMFGVGE